MKKRLIVSLLIIGFILTWLTMPATATTASKYDIIETTAPILDLFYWIDFDESGLAWIEGELTRYTYGNNSHIEHSFINKYGQLVYPISEEYYYNLRDLNGTCIILARTFPEDGSLVYSTADKHGLVDPQGNILLPPIYDFIGWFTEGLAVIKKDGKAGYINAKGDFVLPMIYDDVGVFSEGLAAAKLDDKWGYIDRNGEWVIDPQFYKVDPFYEGYAIIRDNKYDLPYSFIDRSGQSVFNKAFDFATGFECGLATVEIDNKWGAIDASGNVVIPMIYTSLGNYGDEFLAATIKTTDGFKDGMLDRQGNVRISFEYDYLMMNDEVGLITVRNNDKWGVLDKNNQIIVPITYDEGIFFIDGYAAVLKDHKYGYVDTSGKLVVPLMYDMGLAFFDGVAPVRNNGVWSLIDASNNDLNVTKLRDAHYDLVCSFNYGLAWTKKDGKFGVIQLISHPDAWAQPEVSAAISNGLVPEYMQYHYTDDITRKDFCDLIIAMINAKSGMSIDDYLIENGITRDFTAFYDIRGNNLRKQQDMNILAAHALGIVYGKGDHIFDPYGKITRQEAATMLFRAGKLLGVGQQSETISYIDCDNFASWSESAIQYVSSVTDTTNGRAVMGGFGNNTFAPNSYFTYEQAILAILRLYNASESPH